MQKLMEDLPAPKPFIRWAGGKRRLLTNLHANLPKNLDIQNFRFYEPFVGGGALMLSLGDSNADFYIPGNRLIIGDVNPDLVKTYKIIKNHPHELISELKKLQSHVTLQDYDQMRRKHPKTDLQIATRFIYLNKTCFNGIWRVNSKGEFNVPWGKIRFPKLFDETNIYAVSERLRGTKILSASFSKIVSTAKKGDLVYFDPPYLPTKKVETFSAYSKSGFGIEDHLELKETIRRLTKLGIFVLMSNSNSEVTREIYGDVLTLKTVDIHRTISGQNHGRNKTKEIIGINYSRI